ncbi:hypothetical protein AVEN_162523-1 [Araneus ventricosus]|uniref:Uncharacterized protein n=1 Tax=Araneus ventricosus TaxID=182803 RepID=A0A4Y2V6B8_ARAVE|nr:hypothetical protein AVEN_46437-1 [Araneus ventricosus]GBO19287.1 hypothetical protein AVEN_162523-1 [Araneus ventricosus]
MTFLVNPRVFHKILYGQQQQTPSKETLGKKRESTKETKLKMFLKRSSEPILNIQLAQIDNAPLWRFKSAAAGDSQLKCQNGHPAAEGTSDTSVVPRKENHLSQFKHVFD